MGASNLPDIEFKRMVIRMLRELSENHKQKTDSAIWKTRWEKTPIRAAKEK